MAAEMIHAGLPLQSWELWLMRAHPHLRPPGSSQRDGDERFSLTVLELPCLVRITTLHVVLVGFFIRILNGAGGGVKVK